MKTLLIIYPHWHPANLAGVHRPRLIGNFLTEFGWKPRIVTVKEDFFEELPDAGFFKTFSKDFDVSRVNAFKITKPRIIGDIGLRAFWQMYNEALKVIRKEKIDFLWLPIPSFYTALLGRAIHRKTKIPYGIDYIDPWVRDISNRNDWRHRLSNCLAKILEPIAVKEASLITGVSYEYYRPMLKRNFSFNQVFQASSYGANGAGQIVNRPIFHTAFPYGFDAADHKIKLKNIHFPWSNDREVKPWIYAGAFLPNSRIFVRKLFGAIASLQKEGKWDKKVHLYFVGTGSYHGKSISEYAFEAGIEGCVTEDKQRHNYLNVLNYLAEADAVLIIGSTEKHYTASKVYQALLSERPVWAIFHHDSTAVQVMKECEATEYLVRYEEGMMEDKLMHAIKTSLMELLKGETWKSNLRAIEKYSARESARKLVEAIECAIKSPDGQ